MQTFAANYYTVAPVDSEIYAQFIRIYTYLSINICSFFSSVIEENTFTSF